MKTFWVRLASLVIIGAALCGYQSIQGVRAIEREEAERFYKEQIAAAGVYVDGVYEGEGQGFGGPIVVSVTVTEGRIKAVEMVSHENEDAAYFDSAKALIEDIIRAQTADVDTVTGATFSSKGIISAVGAALEEARK